ncbi:MAG: hypothetical protein ACE5F9_00370 [Phycisphaerae bacterium]
MNIADANVVAGLFAQPPCTVGPPVDVVEDTLIDPQDWLYVKLAAGATLMTSPVSGSRRMSGIR